MQRLMLLPLLLLPLTSAFECWSCGVFLNAPDRQCKGSPRNVSCASDKLGCVYISAENPDGTYYIEKNCVQPGDEVQEERCKEFAVRGLVGMQCVCKEELCNALHSPIPSIITLTIPALIVCHNFLS